MCDICAGNLNCRKIIRDQSTTKGDGMEIIDRKFKILAVNPINGKIYTDENALLFCAKDKAVPAALEAYHAECIRLGTNPEHLESIGLLRKRVDQYQLEVESRIPDTLGKEIDVCLALNHKEG